MPDALAGFLDQTGGISEVLSERRRLRDSRRLQALSRFADQSAPLLSNPTPDNLALMDQLLARDGAVIGKELGWPDHRRVVGMDHAYKPMTGDLMLSPRIRNAQTGTTGPQSVDGGVDDEVLAVSPAALAGALSRYRTTQPGDGEDPWRVVSTGSGTAQLYNQQTGESIGLGAETAARLRGITAAGKGGGNAPTPFTPNVLGDYLAVTDKATGNVRFESPYSSEEVLGRRDAESLSPYDPARSNPARVRGITDDFLGNANIVGAFQRGGAEPARLGAAVGNVVSRLLVDDSEFAGDDEKTQREKIVASLLDTDRKGAQSWIRNALSTVANQATDLTPMAEGVAGLHDSAQETISTLLGPANEDPNRAAAKKAWAPLRDLLK